MQRIEFKPAEGLRFQPIEIPFYEEVPAFEPPDHTTMEAHFKEEARRSDLITWTDGANTQLTGIFPHQGEEAFFGYWETKEEATNAEAFAALEAEARQRGYQRLVGPLNGSTFQRYRLKLKESSWPYFNQEPINPLHYPKWLRQLGYSEHLLYESRHIGEQAVKMLYNFKASFIATLEEVPYRILSIDAALWEARLPEIHRLVDKIFSENPYYRPMDLATFKRRFDLNFVAMLCPYCSSFFEDPETGDLVAMSFSYPNYAPLGQQERYQFEKDFPRLKDPCLLIKSIGVHPDHRQKGLMNYLAAHGMRHFLEHYRTAMFCLMRSDNVSLRFTNPLPYEKAGYALFAKTL